MTEVFVTVTEVFPCFSLSCKSNARVKLAKTGHGPHSSTLVVICVVRLLFVLFYVLFVCKCVLLPGDNPIAINKYIMYHVSCGLEVACWPLVPKFAGSNPAEAVGFLRAKKSSARLPSEGK